MEVKESVTAPSIVLLKLGGGASRRYKDVAPILKLCPRGETPIREAGWIDTEESRAQEMEIRPRKSYGARPTSRNSRNSGFRY